MTIAMLLLGLLASWQATQTRQTVDASSTLQARAEVIRAVTCAADVDVLRVDVDIRLVLTSRHARPLIVPASQTVFGFRTAAKPADLPATGWGSLTTMLGRDPDARGRPPVPETPDRGFIILKPGGTLELPVRVMLLVLARDVGEVMTAEVSSGALYDMTPREWREAERKWRSVGELFTASIRSGAFTVPVAAAGERKPCGGGLGGSWTLGPLE